LEIKTISFILLCADKVTAMDWGFAWLQSLQNVSRLVYLFGHFRSGLQIEKGKFIDILLLLSRTMKRE